MKTILQSFEWNLPSDNNHWNRLTKLIPQLKNFGFSGIWLPPASKAAGGKNDVGYATYDLYDLGEFNQKGTIPTKYGTKKELVSLITRLHQEGLEAYADIVFNHFIGADETDTVIAKKYCFSNRLKPLSEYEEVEVWTRFLFKGRKGKYNDYTWSWRNFNGVDYDARNEQHAIMRFQKKMWNPSVDKEYGNYDYLMGANLDLTNSETINQLEKWGKWFVDETQIDGFRLDAIRHMDFTYFKSWLLNRKLQMRKEDLPFIVGEYWSNDVSKLVNYLDESGKLIQLFDVPLHFNFYEAAKSNGHFDMRTIFENTLLNSRSDYAVTFVDNHDTQEGQTLESWVQGWFKEQAYALILLRKEGVPVVFWGDLYGIPSRNVAPVGKNLERMLILRLVFENNRLSDYFDHPDLIGWTAQGLLGGNAAGFAVVLTNHIGGKKQMTVGAKHAGEHFVDLFDNLEESVILDEKGAANFPCKDGSISVWINESDKKHILRKLDTISN